jgi:hypothetical protein
MGGGERDRDLDKEWDEHPQSAFLGAQGDIFSMRAGKGPESVEERQAREGAPEVEGPSLDELLEEEEGPVTTNFTAGALGVNEGEEEDAGADESAPADRE